MVLPLLGQSSSEPPTRAEGRRAFERDRMVAGDCQMSPEQRWCLVSIGGRRRQRQRFLVGRPTIGSNTVGTRQDRGRTARIGPAVAAAERPIARRPRVTPDPRTRSALSTSRGISPIMVHIMRVIALRWRPERAHPGSALAPDMPERTTGADQTRRCHAPARARRRGNAHDIDTTLIHIAITSPDFPLIALARGPFSSSGAASDGRSPVSRGSRLHNVLAHVFLTCDPYRRLPATYYRQGPDAPGQRSWGNVTESARWTRDRPRLMEQRGNVP